MQCNNFDLCFQVGPGKTQHSNEPAPTMDPGKKRKCIAMVRGACREWIDVPQDQGSRSVATTNPGKIDRCSYRAGSVGYIGWVYRQSETIKAARFEGTALAERVSQ